MDLHNLTRDELTTLRAGLTVLLASPYWKHKYDDINKLMKRIDDEIMHENIGR